MPRAKGKQLLFHYIINIPAVEETDVVFIVSSKSTENTVVVVYMTSVPTVEEIVQGPVIQSIVSITNSLRGQLVNCFTTL